jgi:hypothetical protein
VLVAVVGKFFAGAVVDLFRGDICVYGRCS